MKRKSSEIRCLFASSEQSADVLYLAGVFVPDPFLSVLSGRRKLAVVNRLEYGRVKANSRFDEVLELDAAKEEAAKHLKIEAKSVDPSALIRFFAKREKAARVVVPADFPAGLYARLRAAGLELRVEEAEFFPARARKTADEAAAIRAGNAASAAGIRAAEAVLRAARIKGSRLFYEGRPLTSERLRAVVDRACLERGAVARQTIVAGGRQACDPHEIGHGPLRPNELIIVDVFPRVQATGYHGDLTRTFLKGRASEVQRSLVRAVGAAQRAAIRKVKAGVAGSTVHAAANAVFEEAGYATERRGDAFVGFIHSTGHGLGLEIHEPPRVSPGAGRLRTGQVVTIEPGLYYPDIGGCRIEDVVRVTAEGCEKLSSLHYRWEIP